MPELPEVEVLRQGLESLLLNKEVKSFEIRNSKVINISSEQQKILKAQKLLACKRRAKYLILEFESSALLVHLRMTGQMLVLPPDMPADGILPLPFTYYQRPILDLQDKHIHGLVSFTDGSCLAYRDIRKFGRVEYFSLNDLLTHPALTKLGPEPLSKDFKWHAFYQLLQQSKKNIKAFLLDQTKVAGLGNIYVDEALFVSRVYPGRLAHALSQAESKKLFQAISFVLHKGIQAGGTSLKDYLHPDGSKGEHQDHLLVYGRTALPCLNCGTEISKITLAQRGTHYCSHCQT